RLGKAQGRFPQSPTSALAGRAGQYPIADRHSAKRAVGCRHCRAAGPTRQLCLCDQAGQNGRGPRRQGGAAGLPHRGRRFRPSGQRTGGDRRPVATAARQPRDGPARPGGTAAAKPERAAGSHPMNISAPFIKRPIATVLLMVGLLLCGLASYRLLPVASLPNVNYPTISVTAQLPGADPQTMASSVATPLEEQFGQIPGIVQMTSSSTLGFTSVTVQFDLSRNVDGAAADVLAAINAAGGQLPTPEAYNNLIIAYQNGSPLRLRDIGQAVSGPENDLLAGWMNQQRAIILAIQRQPGANVINTVDRVIAMLPQLEASIPPTI